MRLPPLVEPGPPLGEAEARRTARQARLAEIGELGQRRLAAARIVVVGAGGLGAPALLYLAAAGVGTIGIIDDDTVDASNLQRQIVHGTADVGRSKVESATERLHEIAPELTVIPHEVRIDDASAREVFAGYDLVLDGSDNFDTRYAVADAAAALGIPLVWGSVLRFDAQVSVFWSAPPAPAEGVTLRDLFPAPPPEGSVPSCSEAGVLGPVCGVAGSLMAAEAVKLIVGTGDALLGRILVVDGLSARVSEIPLRAQAPTDVAPSVTTPTRSLLQEPAPVASLADVDRGGHVIVDVREPGEFAVDPLPGAISVPLSDLLRARDDLELPSGDLLLYCVSGERAHRAARLLNRRGHVARVLETDVVDVLRARGEANA
ncbi:ThiF family adenylyltransferase [Agromyces atrinae]|uniref:Adenylyltransferase/sulfurtransferase n=1 Tax=Agromyces atrinae TaxID=592376 RepID=A0A4Q2M660_9MICO|nr:ThiF family adenylyltransferase [Agromyces atrinae]MCI2957688.1 ThiF family adenylyltransferase [Agromyces atrinae]NYD67003.1 adenylyltransferase/sulfurtransferase [Agromyces atrinae]RXZ85263.1 molybdopterin-synthase adenylyltransferase [Agromyces atrinae]RXZ85371.1 molybdopterin-synthase adenylyltransferase [Agromyces atrinae]